MSRDPGSIWAPLPEAGAPDGYVKTQFIVHSTGTLGSAAGNRNYFSQAAVVVESTFIVGLTPADPTLQVMDSTDNADANGSANRRGISVEVVGDGVGPYTDWQISELIRLGRWAASTHPIARRIIPSESESGFGWHVMFGAPGPWTSAKGKVCPGGRRIQQLKDVVFPAIFSGANPTSVQEDDMFTDQDRADLQALKVVIGAVLDARPDQVLSNSNGELTKRIRDIHGLVAGLAGQKPGTTVDAAVIAAAIPEDLAEQVVDALVKRLAG